MENESGKIYLGHYRGQVSPNIKDHASPVLDKKDEDAWKTLDRVGLPEDLVKIRAERIKKHN